MLVRVDVRMGVRIVRVAATACRALLLLDATTAGQSYSRTIERFIERSRNKR